MTRGNQREIDRKRAQARAAKHAKPVKGAGTDILKKKETDAERMRAKQKAAEERKAAEAGGGGGKGGKK